MALIEYYVLLQTRKDNSCKCSIDNTTFQLEQIIFYLRSGIIVCASPEFNLFQPSVAFHIKTSHLIWNATLNWNKLIICKRSDCVLCYLFLIISQEYLSQESDPQNCTASWSTCYCLCDILEMYKSSTKVYCCNWRWKHVP